MGTSADRTGGSGGNWTPLKHAANAYVRGLDKGPGEPERVMRLLARHVPLLGGASGASAGARSGTTGVQRLGGLLAGIGGPGLAPALRDLGLERLVGRSRFDLLDELVTLIAGEGDDLSDGQAARDAACDVLDELFADADTWDDLSLVTVTAEDVLRFLRIFLSAYIYNRMPVIAERLARLTDPVAARRADNEIRQVIENLVVISLTADPFSVDWGGAEGRAIAEQSIQDAYAVLEAWG